MRAVGTWLMLAAVMIANGVFRALVLLPVMGPGAAQVVSVALGIALVLLLTRPFLRSLRFASTRTSATIAAAWVAMTVAFEFGFGHWVGGESWSELLHAYDLASGNLWPLVLLAIAAAPFIWRPRRPDPRLATT